MPWVRVDDRFNEHPKLAAVGPAGWGVWLAGLAYCNRNLTDGFIPYAVAEGIGGAWTVRLPDGEAWRLRRARAAGAGLGTALESGFVIGLLVAHGLWAEVPGGYRIHDYADYQPSKAAVLDGRERTRQRVERHRTGADTALRGAEHARGNGVAGDGRGLSNARRNGVTAGPVTPPPVPGPVPMPGPPSRPGGRSGGARPPTAADRDRERLAGLVAELTGRRGGVAFQRGFGALAAGHLARHGWPALEPAYRAVAAACPRPPTLRQLVFGADDLLDRPPERRVLAAAEREAEADEARRRRDAANGRALHRQHFAPDPACRLCAAPAPPQPLVPEAADVA